MKLRWRPSRCLIVASMTVMSAVGASAAATAAPVKQLEVRVVIGAQALAAGSELELRIYETGKDVLRAPLAHAQAWLPDSTHLVPVRLSVAIEPRDVQRFALYYRPSSALAPPFEIVSADVELPADSREPQKLLGATLSGVIARQGELATEDRGQSAGLCSRDADCDDRRACNGRERCEPHARGADERGCVKGTPVVCPVNQLCGEGIGCHGIISP